MNLFPLSNSQSELTAEINTFVQFALEDCSDYIRSSLELLGQSVNPLSSAAFIFTAAGNTRRIKSEHPSILVRSLRSRFRALSFQSTRRRSIGRRYPPQATGRLYETTYSRSPFGSRLFPAGVSRCLEEDGEQYYRGVSVKSFGLTQFCQPSISPS